MKAKLLFDLNNVKSEIDERLYGSFVEHMGRSVYGGIYEPTHPDSDENGFRNDVKQLVKELDVPIIRYPGGNFVSNYDWMDGIGPKEKRKTRLDLAWQDVETNEVGLHEFHNWAESVGSDLMYAINVGTKGIEAASNVLEYSNFPSGTYWSDLRIENGQTEPFAIKTWCIGNEMDGPWQIGYQTSQQYGEKAREIAKAMKLIDESIELVVVGSSGPGMSTFGEWEYDVLMETYEYIDFISLHSYFGNPDNDLKNYLAQSVKMDEMIKQVTAICDLVKHKKQSKKTINLSFDEWNVWYHSNESDLELDNWTKPRPILQDTYNFEDALLVGSLLNTLINNSDRVKIACLAQLVNVIAPIRTEANGVAWKQTTYYPFMYASKYGRGKAIEFNMDVKSYSTKEFDNVQYLDGSVVLNDDNKTTIFLINRSETETIELLTKDFNDNLDDCIEHVSISGYGLKQTNSKDEETVKPVNEDISYINEQKDSLIKLKPLSWNMLRFNNKK